MRRIILSLALLLLVTPALALSSAAYITAAEFDPARFVPPPPAKASAAQAADMAAVLSLQRTRTSAQMAQAEKDAIGTLEHFVVVLGPRFNANTLPKVNAFLLKALNEINALSNVAKAKWERPRPFIANPAIRPSEAMRRSTLGTDGPTFSYPSGHAAFGAGAAILLGDMVPEKREALLARGWALGQSRIIGGVHYPSDIEAGRIHSTVAISLMMQKPAFRADLAEARAELRRALNLRP